MDVSHIVEQLPDLLPWACEHIMSGGTAPSDFKGITSEVLHWRDGDDYIRGKVIRNSFNSERAAIHALNTQINPTYLRQGAINKLWFQ